MGRKIAGFVAVLYVLIVVLCSSTLFWQGAVPELFNKLTGTLAFEEGVFKTSSTELKVKLHDGETELLRDFTQLRSADFSGSDNIDEILQWASANPQVSVIYDIQLPDGSRAASNLTAQDFSGMTYGNMAEYLRCLNYLPNTSQVDLGSESASPNPLTIDALVQLIETYPNIYFSYSFDLLGQSCSLESTSLDLRGISPSDLNELGKYLKCMKKLTTIELGDESSSQLDWDDVETIAGSAPNAAINYSFQLYGQAHTLADETLDYYYVPIDDNGEALRSAMRCMNKLKTVDLDSCGLANETIEALAEEFPQVDVIWRIWFGQLYSVRTDTVHILASKPTVGGVVDNFEASKLRHCTKVKYLDLGHNEVISDISFVRSMPELEVFIIAMNPVADLSPLADCPKLEYLEINTTAVADLSPLAKATALRHLNISNCYMTDISPLYGLTELERLWIGNRTPISAEQIQQMQSAAPNCRISTVSDDPHGDGWRATNYDVNTGISTWHPRYELLRAQLGYDYQEYSFYWLDQKCKEPAPPQFAGTYYIHPDLLDGTAERYGLTR